MDITEFFKEQSRETARRFGAVLRFKTLTHGAKKEVDGVVARFDFDTFFFDIMYAQKGIYATLPDTVWISSGFEAEDGIPFSVYDLLAFFCPDDFNIYTFTSVSDEALMKDAFAKTEKLFIKLLPFMKNAAENGVIRNKMLNGQKNRISEYCGNTLIFDTGVPSSDLTEKLTNMLMADFTVTETASAVTIYSAKKSKAIKKLKRKKHKSQYEKNLLEYLLSEKSENYDGEYATDNVKNAIKKQSEKTFKEVAVTVCATLIIQIPLSAVVLGIYYALCFSLFHGALYTVGTNIYNGILPVAVTLLLSFCIAFRFSPEIENKITKQKTKKRSEKEKKALKFFIIIAETLTLLMCIYAANYTTAFYEDTFTYPENGNFVLRQTKYGYAHIKYYVKRNEFLNPYYVLVANDGSEINLYESTLYNTEDFEEKIIPFLEQKGITSYSDFIKTK